MYVVNAHDSVLNSNVIGCGPEVYYTLDFDLNGIPDFTFTAQCYMGGMSDWSYIRLSSGDGSAFSVDSVIDVEGHYDSVGQVHYTPVLVPMVRIYNEFDTLYSEECSNSTIKNISNFWFQHESQSGFPPPCTYFSLDNWISGPHYIGIRKRMKTMDYLGWIKVEVLNEWKMVVKEYALNHKILDVPQLVSSSLTIYPNPVGSTLFIKDHNCKKVEIYDVFGSLVTAVDHITSGSQVEINVGNLKPGVYFVRIFEKGKVITRKIIKI
jgi:hypothetical protein